MAQDTIIRNGIIYTVNSMVGISPPFKVTGLLFPSAQLEIDQELYTLTVAVFISKIERANPPLLIEEPHEIAEFMGTVEVKDCLLIMKKVYEISGLWPTS